MSDAFTPERIAQLREILARATPGEWAEHWDGTVCPIDHTGGPSGGAVDDDYDEQHYAQRIAVVRQDRHGLGNAGRNLSAIVAAVNTLPAALDEIERLSAERDAWKENAIACGKMLQSFTPGGSEYFGKRIGDDHFATDEKACGAIIRSKLDALHKARCEAVSTARELSRAKAELDEAAGLVKMLAPLVADYSTSQGIQRGLYATKIRAARSFLSHMEGRK